MMRNRRNGVRALLVVAGLAALASCSAKDGVDGRWYSQQQVSDGATVFAENCAGCHGSAAQGIVMNWKKPDANGNYPAPPLNGTAHAWHHPLSQLRRTVRQGGIPLGGQMPAFAQTLNDAEIEQAIAYFQSHWSDEIYAAWLQRGGLK